MNLLWLESSIAVAAMSAWVIRENKKFYDNALASLSRLHILPNAAAKLALNSTFKANLRQAITGG